MENFCEDCHLNILEMNHFDNPMELFRFFQEHGIITLTKCPRCDGEPTMTTKNDKMYWRCQKTHTEVDDDGNIVKFRCNFWQSVFHGTWLNNCKVPLKKILILVKLFCEDKFKFKQTAEILEVNNSFVTNWIKCCRQVCSDFVETHPNKIGGEGKVVEIDESKFGRRKNHKGRIIEGKWVVGGVQVDDKTNCFFEPVEDRSSKTLMEIILRNVQPGTTIVTDCWRGYIALKDEHFHHLTVNHRYNFVDPNTGAHTNSIEREWRDLKENVQKWILK